MRLRGFAFTFIELLVVVSTIAILAAIAVPNFLEAQVRSKTAHTRTQIVAVAEAMEAYYADHLGYPPNLEPFHPAPGQTVQPSSRLKLFIPVPPTPGPTPVGYVAARPLTFEDINGVVYDGGNPFAPPLAPMPLPLPGVAAPSPASGDATTSVGLASDSGRVSTSTVAILDPFALPSAGQYITPTATPAPTPSVDVALAALDRPWLESYGGAKSVVKSMTRYNFSASPSGTDVSGRLVLNGFALIGLTTPLAYLSGIPIDAFDYASNGARLPMGYFCYSPYDTADGWSLPAPHGGSPHYLLFSHGPNTGPDILDPYFGPFEPYDPTNGTVSNGDIFSFDGRPSW